MNLRELAFQLSAITLIADTAKEAKERLRREFAAALEEVGADSVKAAFDGEDIAKVSLVQPKTSPEILHESAFTEWVKANWSSEIIETVRESFKKHLLDEIVNVNGNAVYPKTGEVLNFVGFNHRDPYISTRFIDGGRDALYSAFRSGSLSPADVISYELAGVVE